MGVKHSHFHHLEIGIKQLLGVHFSEVNLEKLLYQQRVPTHASKAGRVVKEIVPVCIVAPVFFIRVDRIRN